MDHLLRGVPASSDPDAAAWPKVELHLHVDCCLTYDAAHDIDERITRELYRRRFIAPARGASLAAYIAHTLNYRRLLQSERALRIMISDAFAQLARDSIVYAELRFAPLVHTKGGLWPEDVVGIVADECGRQSAASGIGASLILCALREFSPADSMRTARLVTRFAGDGWVAAFDVAGDEASFDLAAHAAAFNHVRGQGLPFTVHAGESNGAEGVWEALDLLDPSRIGHGIAAVSDPALVDELRARRIHLEICPTSNVQTGSVADLGSHPIKLLAERSVALSVSTDTRGVTGVTLTEEYARLRASLGWQKADFARINLQAAEAAFAPPLVRAELARTISIGYGL